MRRLGRLTGGAMAALVWLAGLSAPLRAQDRGNPSAGKALFDSTCVACHGSNGKGDGPAADSLNPKPRDLTNPSYVRSLSDQEIFDVIKGGGWSVKKSPLMPAWGHALKDKEIWNLVAYIRSLARQKPAQ
jgi:mono/diheme cytochrome c family protein